MTAVAAGGPVEADRPGTDRLLTVVWWVVFVAVSALTLVWLTVGALVSTPLNEPPGQAIVDYLASAVNLVVAVVLLRHGGRSWAMRLLALAMVGSAGAFNLQAHAAALAVQEATGIEIGEAHQILLHGVAGAAFAGALLLVPVETAGSPGRRRVVYAVVAVTLFVAGVGTALLPHTLSCVVFFGFAVPLLGVAAIAPGVRRGPTPEARARARLLTSVLVAAVGAATVLAVLTAVLVALGHPGLTLDDPTAHHSPLGMVPTALLFWFARLTAAVIALAVLVARRARPAERWMRGGLAALVTIVLLGGLAVLLATVVATVTGSAVVGYVVAVVVVAALWLPVSAWTDRLAERLLYGTRATPAGVLAEVSELSRRTAGDPTGLDRVPEAVGRALGARAVRLTTRRDGMSDRTSRWRAPDGGADEDEVAFPVRHEGAEVGTLVVDAETLAGGDDRRRLVSDVADGLGGVLAAHRLEIELERQLRVALAHAEEIAASRRRLVSEMDSERRAIERNLHDGAQHHLVSLRLTLGLVEHLVGAARLDGARERLDTLVTQLDTAESVLAETATGVSSATLRRLGPLETLRSDLAEAEPPIAVEGDGVARHDEAIESAVYFCALEAVNNARKHAGGAAITVRVSDSDGVLRAVVRDEGPGFTPTPGQGPGRGLRNFTTRLSPVSGRVELDSAPGAGTTVRVEVPLPAEPAPVAVPDDPAATTALAATIVRPVETTAGSTREDVGSPAVPEPVERIRAVVPVLGPPRPAPDPSGPGPAPLPPSGSRLFDASIDLLRRIVAQTPPQHPVARPLAGLLARYGTPWRIGVAGPNRPDAAATARAVVALCPRPALVVDLSARAAEGPLAPEDVVDVLVLLAEDEAGSWVPGWLADLPTVDVRVVPAVSVGDDEPSISAAPTTSPVAPLAPVGHTVRVALPGPGSPEGRNLERVVEVVVDDCRPRAARSRARAVLDELDRLARRGGSEPWARRVLFDVERVRAAGAQEVAEAELAEALRTGRLVLPEAHRDAAVRLLGRDGISPRARLGLEPTAETTEVTTAALEQRARWQRLAAHIPAQRAVRDAAEVLASSCEGLISTAGRAAAR
ncbi:histidine kinase [Actinomycetospora endophytica]|uniref:histidine kinase n=1 Tax=Actinomycetospora endophytica TaxID=2291215 RepID=A0ABS8PEK1_9PSEU|nr:ATP-binding protein [Actinomycetospora endophytica]MCD2196692.1 histidine kinase [Actinomycetospora endophytica]